MFGQSPSNSIFGKGNKTGSAAAPKNSFYFGGFGDENDSSSNIFLPDNFSSTEDDGDSVFKMPEPPGSYPPPLQQQQLLRSPAVNAIKQLPKPSPSTSASPVLPSKPAEAKTTAAAPVIPSPYFKNSSHLSSPAQTGKKDDLNKTVTFDLEESVLEEQEEEFQKDCQESRKRKRQQDEPPPQSPSHSAADTDEEGSAKDGSQPPMKKKKNSVPEDSSDNNHRLGGIEKLRAEFSEIMQQHNKIREEDGKLLQICSDSLRSKTEELIHQMEEFVRERYDYLTEKIQQAANDFTTIAEEAQVSESDVNEMKRFMAELIEKHLKFPNDN